MPAWLCRSANVALCSQSCRTLHGQHHLKHIAIQVFCRKCELHSQEHIKYHLTSKCQTNFPSVPLFFNMDSRWVPVLLRQVFFPLNLNSVIMKSPTLLARHICFVLWEHIHLCLAAALKSYSKEVSKKDALWYKILMDTTFTWIATKC